MDAREALDKIHGDDGPHSGRHLRGLKLVGKVELLLVLLAYAACPYVVLDYGAHIGHMKVYRKRWSIFWTPYDLCCGLPLEAPARMARTLTRTPNS